MEVSSASKISSSKYLSSSSSSCNFIQEVVRAFFRCLGFETNKTQEEPAEPSESQAIEKHLSTNIATVIRTRAAPRSGLSTGSGGQTY